MTLQSYFFIIDIFASGIQIQILEKSCLNKRNIFFRAFLPLIPLSFFLYSCNPTKYVPEGKTLLNGNHIEINRQGMTQAELSPYIRQKPNKKIFGARFHLGLYNLSNINKEKWPHGWLRNIGEEPVIFDSLIAEKSREQLLTYVSSKGYFDG